MTQEITDTLEQTREWFKRALREPTDDNMRVQLGVHVEEVAEMFMALGMKEAWLIDEIAKQLKTNNYPRNRSYADVDRKELLDSLCDQIVTAVGIAHMYNLDIVKGLQEVNRSNWSKFVDGKPIFNESGKIAKGPDYTPPNLENLY